MCVLVIGCTSPRLHLEKILIFSSVLLNHKQPIGWHWCAFQTQRLSGWIVAEENTKSLKPLFVFHPESLRKVLSQSQEWGVNAINLWPQRREREGWSRIEPRILDSAGPQKASIRARTASTDASLGCEEQRSVDWSSFLPHSTNQRRESMHTEERPAAERLLKTGSLWTDRGDSPNQGAYRPWCSFSGLFYIPTALTAPFTQFYSWILSSFYFMVSVFKGLSFVSWKAVRLSRPFVEWTYYWIVEIVSCTEALAKSWNKTHNDITHY